jgi:hypothetical protein
MKVSDVATTALANAYGAAGDYYATCAAVYGAAESVGVSVKGAAYVATAVHSIASAYLGLCNAFSAAAEAAGTSAAKVAREQGTPFYNISVAVCSASQAAAKKNGASAESVFNAACTAAESFVSDFQVQSDVTVPTGIQ